jgi:hypothetical protein
LSEDILQAEIFKWYHNNFCTKKQEVPHVIFSVPNGAFVSKRQAMKLKSTGLVAGVSDLIIIQPSRCLFVELKFEKGKQSEGQISFQKKVEMLGFEYIVVRSLEEFKQKIK